MILAHVYPAEKCIYNSNQLRGPPLEAISLCYQPLRGVFFMENNIVMDKLIFDLQLCGMSPTSQSNYHYHVRRFAQFCNQPITETGEEDVRQFLHHLRYARELSIGSVNYYHTCLRFLFEATLDKPWNSRRIPRLRGYKTVPVILSKQEVGRILAATENLKQKAILSTIYGSGLRISEACRLRVTDIRSSNSQIFVRCAKGNKDRYTVLSQENLLVLRRYWQECGKPREWLFPGAKTGQAIHPATVRGYLEQSCKRAGIRLNVSIHTLRHCFATHFLEDGNSIYVLKDLLGHASLSSTARYIHMVRPSASAICSPLDTMELDDES